MSIGESNTRSFRKLHILEKPMGAGCYYDPQTDLDEDPRYIKTGDFSISEYDLYTAN